MESITRIVKQEWFESESKNGFDSVGWFFVDDEQMILDEWIVIENLDLDKFGNPILGIAQKEQ